MMKINNKSICLRLGDERKRLNLNQAAIADYCGVSSKSVSRWEKSIAIPADKLAMLALLGYDITYVLTSVKLASQLEGLDAAARVLNRAADNSEPISPKSNAVSDDQQVWLDILSKLAGGDNERLRQMGLALVGYSEIRS